ncbi:oxygenase MpaB family protein [Actinocorallia populi]|uniref:oxygenase MpaB family protein n=1 Tax=Actinocorallia populi TaxID=2079200 RepID=UPI000D08890D|nr:oxygenase MpaB family protein [Actinocorallia populi]
MTEPGLFHDGDIIRKITREGILIASGGAASILQTSHPGVGQGVYDHSYTFKNPLGRLQNTMEWLYAVQFGSEEEAEIISSFARRMHDTVNGPGYDAQDAEAQVWVGATLFDIALRFYQALFGSLSPDEVEEFYQQTRVYAQLMGAPAEAQPQDFAEFKVYYRKQLDSFELTEASRQVAHQLLYGDLPLHLRPGLVAIRLLTAGLMPEPLRTQYGWKWNAARQRRFVMLVNVLRIVYPRLPLSVRTLPREFYSRNIRKKVERVKKRGARISVRSTA